MPKSDAQRGPYGAWAYRTRTLLDLNSQWVADQLGYTRPTLVKVEAGSIEPSQRMRDSLEPFYARMADKRGITIPRPPERGSEAPTPSQDITAVLDALREQTDLLRQVWRSIDNLAAAIRGSTETRFTEAEVRELLKGIAQEWVPRERPSTSTTDDASSPSRSRKGGR